MPTDQDLFTEENTMASMSFGEHIEELRTRLILGVLGLMVGVVLALVPPFYLGKNVIETMEMPAKVAMEKFYADRARIRQQEAKDVEAESQKKVTPFTPVPFELNPDPNDATPTRMQVEISAADFLGQVGKFIPGLKIPDKSELAGKTLSLPMLFKNSELIGTIATFDEPRSPLVSLAPLETITIFFMVSMVTGLVISSPWVFYQAWAFVAAGLYFHERKYVYRYLPFSLGLFLGGVFLCFFFVLPTTLSFLLEFNVWLGIEPTLRLSEWMSFATILPLVFGLSFQTPLIMLFLERIGVFTVDDYRSKRKMAILIVVVAAAILTPGPDVFSQCMLAVPVMGLYELGILMVAAGKPKTLATTS
ncbi:twin-arginine translocase subunit TatC [Isosphaeraceae bacterium EP7]